MGSYTTSKIILEEERPDWILFFEFCIQGAILRELDLKVMILENISGETMMRIVFNSEKLFSTGKIQKGVFEGDLL